MRTRTHFSLQLLGLVTVLLIGTVTWTGCQGCEMQPGMSPEGWCCRGDEVFPCIEHECYDTGGDFFPTEHEAVAHCEGQMQGQMPPGEGWCCRNGDVFPCPEHECYDTGGDFFPTEHEAMMHCGGQMPPGEGWCCDGGNVSPCSEDECHSWGGAFFLYEHEAVAHCGGQMPPGEGWCCDAGNVAPCSEAECHGWGGVFFLYEHEAIAHCQGSAPGPPPAGAPVVHYFTANPSTISAGQTSTLKWDVSGTSTVSLAGSNTKFLTTFGATDQEQVSPMATEVYTLTATNSAGTVTDTATVTVAGSAPPAAGLPVINYFTATPSTITAGQSTTLKWDVSGATQPLELVLNDPLHTVLSGLGYSGQKTDSPTATGVYTLRATNSAGTVTATAQVTVNPPGGGGWSGPPKVTNVTANAVPPSYTGPGPTTINFVADITVDGPCTVTYKWERSDGVIGLQQTLVFSAAGTKKVSDTWTLGGGPGTGIVWERVSILTPLPMLSNKAQFTLNITP